MTYEQTLPTEKDAALWELAQKRVKFKKSISVYIIVNIFLWALWYFTSNNAEYTINSKNIPWPIFPTLGWGIGMAFQYVDAYISPKTISVENEYQKLKNK